MRLRHGDGTPVAPAVRLQQPACDVLLVFLQTGSGKTAAFCFPIVASMLLNNYQPQQRTNRKATPYALVLAPTRELTCQIYDEARKFTYQTGIRPVVIYGGAPVVQQVRLGTLISMTSYQDAFKAQMGEGSSIRCRITKVT